MIREFRDFLLRGNIVELAVAFMIGAAFALVVKSLNDNLLTPIIAKMAASPTSARCSSRSTGPSSATARSSPT